MEKQTDSSRTIVKSIWGGVQGSPFLQKGAPLLHLLSAVPAAGYYGAQKIRAQFYSWGLLEQKKPPITVVSVGNVLLGGSGKTPFVLYLAELLRQEGFNPAVISRGYKGSNRHDYLVVNDGRSCEPLVAASVAGDEPYLIANSAREIPVIIGRERIHPVKAAYELFHCDVAVLDDGFQHLPIARQLDIVLVNGSEDRMFPLGRLREPLSALRRADVVMLAGIDSVPEDVAKYISHAEIFRCRFEAAVLENLQGSQLCSHLKGTDVVLCSAIAGPERFCRTAEQLGWVIYRHWVFRDHHTFTDSELLAIAEDSGDRPIVVTDKDWVKLPEWFRKKDRVFSLRIRTVVENEEEFLTVVKRSLIN
jgi:tetraacyldisaccharide 4'-kinase